MKLEIKISNKPVEYYDAIKYLEERVIKVQNKESKNLLWILEHPNLYSAGTSAKDTDLLNKNKFPIYKTNRGGQWTFHGEGQKIIYFVIDLTKEKNIKNFVRKIENWIKKVLNNYKIESTNDPNTERTESVLCVSKSFIVSPRCNIPLIKITSGINSPRFQSNIGTACSVVKIPRGISSR